MGSETKHGRGRTAAVAAVVVVSSSLLAGCQLGTGAAGDLAKAKQVASTCPHGKQLASFVGVDASGSARTRAIPADKRTAIDQVATRTVICGGHLQVSLFSATNARTVQLFDQQLSLSGATQNARLRQTPKVVAAVMKTIDANYTTLLPTITPDGSDILGVYPLAGQYASQLGGGYQLNVTLLTDGVQSSGPFRVRASMTPAQAAALGKKVPLPALPGASVTIAGLGTQENGSQPDSGYVANLVAFYSAVCQKVHAAACQSVTDYTSGQWAA